MLPGQKDHNMTAQGISSSDLRQIIEARRRELHVSPPEQKPQPKRSIENMSLEEIKQLALQKVRENGKEADYKMYFDLTPEQRLQKQADDYNAAAGDLTDYDCTICHNKGHIAVVRDGEIRMRECKCMGIRRTWRRIHASGLEAELKSKRFDNYKHSEQWQQIIFDKAQQYLKEASDYWFAICGQTGAGKTHICTAIVGQLIKSGHEAIYMPYRDDIVKIKQSANDAESYQSRMEELKRVDVLYIDDLFKGKVTDADINAIYELIGYRYNNRKTTIISTEILWDELSKIDGAIAGRINEMCKYGEYLITIGLDEEKNYRLHGGSTHEND